MMPTINNSGPLVSENDIRMVEIAIRNKLPSEYRLFLSRHNGGHPEPSCFNSFSDKSTFNGSCIHYFYGIGDESPHSQLLTAFNILKGRIPKELIPIADDPFGNQVCIAIEGKEIGTIYFWDHEAEHQPPSFQNTYMLAPSFELFISAFFEIEHPCETDLDKAIKNNDVKSVTQILNSGVNLEKEDQWGRTLIENAAIANAVDVIGYLFSRGANLRNALALAEENEKYFPDHHRTVMLLRQLNIPSA